MIVYKKRFTHTYTPQYWIQFAGREAFKERKRCILPLNRIRQCSQFPSKGFLRELQAERVTAPNSYSYWLQGLGFKVLGFRDQCLGFIIQGLGFTVYGLGFTVQGLGFLVKVVRGHECCQARNPHIWQGLGFRVYEPTVSIWYTLELLMKNNVLQLEKKH